MMTPTRRCVLETTVASLRDTLRLLVHHLVDDPDAVEIVVDEENDPIVFAIHCAAGEVGKLVGKSGRNIQAVRALMSAIAAKHQRQVQIEIIEPDVTA